MSNTVELGVSPGKSLASAKVQKITSIVEWSGAMSLFGAMVVSAVTIYFEGRKLVGYYKGSSRVRLSPSLM